MRKVSSYKCPECGMSYKTLSGWGEHMRRLHPETIPKGWSDARFFYYTLTGKSEGSCIQCHKPTEWNEATGKYSRYCNDPKCKQEYCKVAKQRMIDKYGKPHLLDDPEKQREMLKGKKISGEYKFSDGGKLPYVGSYERDFLMTCDVVLGLSSKDIIAPSPHNYVYMYEDKPHFYIPDFYIPDFNLEIEVKDGGDNPNKHHKIQEVDKVKEKLKDQVMIGNPAVNYFKVVDKKYDDFFDFILKCKNAIDDDKLQQVQAKITSNRTPAMEAIRLPPLFEARKNAMIEADRFAAEFDSVAGPMFKREIEIAFAKYRDYNSLTHQYSYPYTYTRRAGKFIDSTYKNNENIIIEIPLMVVNTQTPHRFDNDASFDDKRIIDILSNFERNIMSTIKLRNVYKRFPNVSAPYVQWDGYDWMLKVTFNYSVESANESIEDIANEGAYISYKDEYFNLENWKREVGHNILYIAGLSGSGKSTLGYELSKKYGAIYIELDKIMQGLWVEDERFNPNGYQGNVNALLREILKDEDPRDRHKTIIDERIVRKRRYTKIYEYCMKHPDQLFIFEGVQVSLYFDAEFLIDKPLIIKNTSMNTSFKRMTLRDREPWVDQREDYHKMQMDYKYDEHELESLRKLMRSKASKSKALPAVESAKSNEPADFDEYQKIYKSLSKKEQAMYGYGVGIDNHTTYTKRIGDAYVILDDYPKSNQWHPYPGKYISIAAAPSVRGTGVTDKLVTAAKNSTSDDIIAIIRDDNIPSIKLFTRNGFKYVCNKKSNEDQYNYYIYRHPDVANEGIGADTMKSVIARTGLKLLSLPDAISKLRNKGKNIDINEAWKQIERDNRSNVAEFIKVLPKLTDDIKRAINSVLAKYNFPERAVDYNIISARGLFDKRYIEFEEHSNGKYMSPEVFHYMFSFYIDHLVSNAKEAIQKNTEIYKRYISCRSEVIKECNKVYNNYESKYKRLSHHVDTFDDGSAGMSVYVLWKLDGELDESKYEKATESAGSDASYYGLPEDKKYPMDDPKHVLLAIKFFNYVDEDKERLLASRFHERIMEFGIHIFYVGEKNRFAKYYEPVEEEVLVDWAPNVPYMTVANEGADPSVKLLDDGFAYAPIMLDSDLYEKYNGTDYYPLYIILMKNISPLGSAIRGFTREEYSHAAISFDASMEDVYTFGNSVIKKPFGRQKSFGAAHESFRKNSFKFSYSEKTEYSLYVMFFKKDEIDRIKKKVDEIFLHHDEYKYNVEGLISYVFNKPKTDPKKLFCSQFVALVINSGRNGILNKDPSMYTPVGLTTIRGVCHIETGRIYDYDQYRVEKKTHRVFDSLIENKAYEALEHANIMYNA